MLHSKSWINWSIIRQVGRHNSRHNLQRIRFARCGFLRPVLDVNKQYFTAIFEIACHLRRQRQTRRASSPSFFETYEHSLFHKDSSVIRLRPKYPNHIWSVDFVHDRLSNGRLYKMLTVIDEYTREALTVSIHTKMNGEDVLEALYPLLLKHGKPEFLRSDNGPEFISQSFQSWLKKVGIEPIRIYPGSPWENGYNERFNGTLRHEVLNTEWFTTIGQARTVIGRWLKKYNQVRPHQALNMRPPVPETLPTNGPE